MIHETTERDKRRVIRADTGEVKASYVPTDEELADETRRYARVLGVRCLGITKAKTGWFTFCRALPNGEVT